MFSTCLTYICRVIATISFRTPMFENKERQLSHSLLQSLIDCHAQCYATSIVIYLRNVTVCIAFTLS